MDRKHKSINPSQWQAYIEQQIGFVLPRSQQLWLSNAIEQVAKEASMNSETLWQALPNDKALQQRFIDHIVITQTHFFRHMPSVEFVTQSVSRQLCQILARFGSSAQMAPPTKSLNLSTQPDVNHTKKAVDKVKVWCAGCSTGQEVWSLAMAIHSQMSKSTNITESWLSRLSILGTDVSVPSIEQAKKAQYPTRQLAEIPKQYQRYIDKDVNATFKANHVHDDVKTGRNSKYKKDNPEQFWQVTHELHKLVKFCQSNVFLPKENTQSELYDVIFCQNMLIYFREFDQRDLLSQFVKQCHVGGYLLLAPGEAVSWQHPLMRRVKRMDINAWQKISE